MTSGPILLCYDASNEAAAAISAAAERLCSREAVVVTVRGAISKWEPDDPRAVTAEDAASVSGAVAIHATKPVLIIPAQEAGSAPR